jgi:hypothetical protein
MGEAANGASGGARGPRKAAIMSVNWLERGSAKFDGRAKKAPASIFSPFAFICNTRLLQTQTRINHMQVFSFFQHMTTHKTHSSSFRLFAATHNRQKATKTEAKTKNKTQNAKHGT